MIAVRLTNKNLRLTAESQRAALVPDLTDFSLRTSEQKSPLLGVLCGLAGDWWWFNPLREYSRILLPCRSGFLFVRRDSGTLRA